MVHHPDPDPVAPAPRLGLVLGGARSGKSRFAEALLGRVAAPWTYIATAQAFDDEMRARIAEHRRRRDARWHAVEAPLDLTGAIRAASGPVLVDCLTLWLSNLLLGGHDVDRAGDALEAALAGRAQPTVLVSNEVGLGVVPDNALARRFRDHAGRLHQRIAAQADLVVFMVAGLPIHVKGPP